MIELPGKGGLEPFSPVSIEAYRDHVAARSPEGALIVGQSLGGLVAIAMAARGWGGIAFDPPMTTTKLWPQQYSLRTEMARNPANSALRGFAFEIFGLREDGGLQERIYYSHLAAVRARVDIVTGDTPLFPPYGAPGPQCVFDAVDAEVAVRNPCIRVHRISGPHDLLAASPEACARLIAARLEDDELSVPAGA